MFTQEWRAQFLDKQIVATNSWGINISFRPDSGVAKLYIDGECVDTNNSTFLSSKTPSMRGKISTGNESHLVEVYMKSGLLKVKAKILVDGKKIIGDNF